MKTTKLLLSFLILYSTITNGQNLANGLAVYWPLNGNAQDMSGQGLHGTLKGSPGFVDDLNVKDSGAIIFSTTTQFVRCGDILDSIFTKNPVAQFSISLWAYFSQIPTSGSRYALISKSAGGSGPYQWYLLFDPDQKVRAAVSSKELGPVDWVEKASLDTLSVKTWYHIVMQFDGSQSQSGNRVQIFVNKVPGTTNVTNGTLGTTTTNTSQEIILGGSHLAGNPNSVSNNLKGSLDEVRIYGRLLDSSDIAKLYEYRTPLKENGGLVAHWPLDNNALDLGPNLLHGTLLNSPTATTDVNNNTDKAYLFNGTNSFIKFGDILDQAFVNTQAQFSVSFWAKATAYPGAGGRSVPLGKSAGGPGPYQWYFFLDSDKLMKVAVCSTVMGPADWIEKKTTSQVNLNQWYHYVLVFDGTKNNVNDRVMLYRDTIAGVLGSVNGSMGRSPKNSVQNITIGGSHKAGDPNTIANSFTGALDEINIYNRVLSPAEIGQLYAYRTITSGIIENNFKLQQAFYPNPNNSGIFYFDPNSLKSVKNTISVYNNIGQQVGTYTIDGNSINLSNLPDGLYFIQLDLPEINPSYSRILLMRD